MGKTFKKTLYQRGYTDGKWLYKKMVNIINNQKCRSKTQWDAHINLL